MTALFRPEVIEARAERLNGAILLTQPVRYWSLGILIAATVAGALIWASQGSYARIESAPGVVTSIAPIAKIFALRPGVITRLTVQEGDLVEAGRPLAIVQMAQADGGGLIPEAVGLSAIAEQSRIAGDQIGLERRRETSERQRLTTAIASFTTQRAGLEAQIAIEREIVASAKSTFDQLGPVVERGFVSRLDYERRRQAWLVEQQRLRGLEQQAQSLAMNAAQAGSELQRLPLEVSSRIGQLRTSQQSLVQSRAQMDGASAYTIKAPVSGRVTALQTGLGRLADPRVPLMAIAPVGGQLQADIFAPSRAIGFVRPGQSVRLLYDAFPYQRFGSFPGQVLSVTHSIIAPNELDAPFQVRDPVYRVRVRVADQSVQAFGEQVPLQPGMTLSANIVLDRRPFLDWLLQPLRAVRARS